MKSIFITIKIVFITMKIIFITVKFISLTMKMILMVVKTVFSSTNLQVYTYRKPCIAIPQKTLLKLNW